MAKRWTEQEDNILRTLYPEHTKKEIAHLLQRTENAVQQRLSRLNLLNWNAWTEEDDKKLEKMYNNGCSYLEMGDELGRSARGVGHRLRKLEIINPNGPRYIRLMAGMGAK
jgi:hypothetical protein